VEKRLLGGSDLAITLIGFGAWQAGGHGWPGQEDADSIAAVRRAIAHGVNWIDTAAVYGHGHSEEVVARALRGVAERPYVFTKCAIVWDGAGESSSSLDPASLRRELEDSLRRLEVEAIDLYQVHWPIPDDDIEEGWRTLADFQREGKVRWIGVSNFDVGQMRRAQVIAPITSLQPPYSLLHRDVEQEILPFCEREGIGVIVYSPLASGLLSGTMTRERAASFPEDDWRADNEAFREPRLSEALELADRLATVGARHGRSAGEAAIAWTLANPAVTGAIVGFRSADQVDGLAGAADLRLDDEDLRFLSAVERVGTRCNE
jgi:aryl-alcohol dehydrogenase-like predicted oxidoreductase